MEIQKENIKDKLEQIKPNLIEIPGHKENLKKTLMEWKYGRKSQQPILFAHKKLIMSLSGAAVILLLIFTVNTLLNPQLTLAGAQKIALKDAAVQKLISEGSQIKDIQIIDKKAFILMAPSEPSKSLEASGVAAAPSLTAVTSASPVLVEVSFKEQRVTAVNNVTPPEKTLTAKQKEEAATILINSQPDEKSSAGSGVVIESINPVPVSSSGLKLAPSNGGVKVVPEEEKVRIIYKSDNQQKESEVNITTQSIESTQAIDMPQE